MNEPNHEQDDDYLQDDNAFGVEPPDWSKAAMKPLALRI